MSTTTPNFGWVVPTSTDLVKDGASAIETLGDSIDASLVDLKGGTTGQVLSKNTNTDMDFTWVTPNDADAIQNTIIDAKGDLIVGASSDTPARLAVGTNDYVLTADSSATNGVAWKVAPASSGPTFRAFYSGTSTTTTGATWVKVQLADESFDTDNCFDPTTGNYKFTPTKAGYYQFNARVFFNDAATSGYTQAALYKNGSVFSYGPRTAADPDDPGCAVSDIIYLNGSTDYVELFARSSNNNSITGGSTDCYMSGHWIRS